jgi:hypothetical protein
LHALERDRVVDRGGECGVADLDRAAALDEHLLFSGVAEVGAAMAWSAALDEPLP